jgi:hypothetical protein
VISVVIFHDPLLGGSIVVPDFRVPLIVAARLIVPVELHVTVDGFGMRVVVVSTTFGEGD